MILEWDNNNDTSICSNNIILYHGTDNKNIVPKIKGIRGDFGVGFYLTEDIEMAKIWSKIIF